MEANYRHLIKGILEVVSVSKKTRLPGFEECLRMMRKHSKEIQEDGYHHLMTHAAEFVNQLMDQFQIEEDRGIRWWLLELIGEAKSPEAFPLLVECLRSDDQYLRQRAIWGLLKLDTKDARRVLWEAQTYELVSEEETEGFRRDLEAFAGLKRGGSR